MVPHYKHIAPLRLDLINQMSFVAEKYLRYLPRTIPDFPSHGPDHSINIIEIIDKFVDNWDANLSDDEIFLLYVSAWFHDIGCLINRDNHQNHSVTILNRNSIVQDLLGKEMYTCLKSIVKYHSSDEDLKEVPLKWGRIDLQKVCAIFRMLDACEITEIKCPKGVYDIMITGEHPMSARADQFWRAHMNIESIQFECPKIKIYVEDCNISALVIERLELEIENDVADILSVNNVTSPTVEVTSIDMNYFVES
ncbi:MAG: hypothetical protein ABSE13_06170 [Methanoregula sp.]|jgi:hypothetical protein